MINPKMIVLAREARGYTQNELSELLGIAQGTLSKIEKGLQQPMAETINNISSKLNFPVAFFEQSDNIYNPDLIYYRKRISVGKKNTLMVEALMNIIRMNIERLLESVELPENKLINWSIEENGTPEEAAIYLRQQWGLAKGKIENLSKLLEDNGVIIIEIELTSDKMDGISMFTEFGQPIIFISNRIPGDRQRFTLAHELGHLVMHIGKMIDKDRDEEKEAMNFAGEFLMPRKDFLSTYENIDLRTLAQQKSFWLVSMAAILYRYKELGLITDSRYRYIWQQMSSAGYKRTEPIAIAREQPSLMREILNIHQKNLGYSKEELAHILNITEEEINRLYYQNGSTLRILR
jgi:Zn-dependent peptidase ImmA (M78 family)